MFFMVMPCHNIQIRAYVNSLWHRDAIWRHRTGSILAQVMACCLVAPSHHLNPFWLVNDAVLLHSVSSSSMSSAQHINLNSGFENDTFRIVAASPRGQWINLIPNFHHPSSFSIDLHYPRHVRHKPGPPFIKPDQLDPWIKGQIGKALLSTILTLQLPNYVSCGRACPSHMTSNLVTVGAKLLTGVVSSWLTN